MKDDLEAWALRDLEPPTRPADGDRELLARVVTQASSVLAIPVATPTPAAPGLFSLKVLGIGLAALAIGAAAWFGLAPHHAATSAAVVPSAPTTPWVLSEPAPSVEVAPVATVAVSSASATALARPAASIAAPTAAELFARASAARRTGDDDRAIELYAELARLYPASPEASTARVARGRILLDHRGDPTGALVEFDAYLARGGPLREEALVGRALALGKLGRASEERETWQTIVDDYPSSVSAERAKAHLGAAP
jgi:tetratricopeptide (TPR) repeat protein